ncbi:MAG: RraA family protein [Gaiellaceae bacterium]
MADTSTEYYDTIERELYSAVVADVLDELGFRDRHMRSDIRPIYEGAKIIGRAATLLVAEVFEIPEEPYKLELEMLDNVKPGEVLMLSTPPTRTAAIFGELMGTRVRVLGGRGAMIDGLTRDVSQLIEMKFPVFCAGTSPADAKGRLDVIGIRAPISVGGVLVRDGELVIADADGCVVVPAEAENETIAKAREKVSGEDMVRDRLLDGDTLADVFRDTGIL